jgi:hypothetical protein
MRNILWLVLFIAGCSPIRQIERNRELYQEVKEMVIANGDCINDTIIKIKTDTTLVIDTLVENHYDTLRRNDTLILWEKKIYNFKETKTIRDTVIKYVSNTEAKDIWLKKESVLKSELSNEKTKFNLAVKVMLGFGVLLLLLFYLLIRKK